MREPGGYGSSPYSTPRAATVAGAARHADSAAAPQAGLHVCRHCGGGLAHPLDWTEDSPERWRILMRCPECECIHEGVFGRSLVERLDDELDRASATLLSDLKALTQANMREEIDRFARALQLDLIGPEDF